MIYQVTYRLLHPEYLPATRTSEIKAPTRAEMLARVALLIDKWNADGYTVDVRAIVPVRNKRRRFLSDQR